MDFSALLAWLAENWDTKSFFNSTFFTSIAGSLAGAFAGAIAAQRIAESGKYRDQLLKEIRDTNAAISIAFGISNSLLSLKRQHLKALKEDFYKQRAEVEQHRANIDAGLIPAGTPFEVHADMQSLSLPPLAVEPLQRLVFDQLSVRGRPLHLTMTLGQSIHGLRSFLEMRNQLIEQFKVQGFDVALYFGFTKGGHTRAEYRTTIDAIYGQLDDSIFFSILLCKDLVEHGHALRARFNENFRKGAPRINEPDFAKAEQAGLMPDAANYNDWLTMFRKPEPAPDGWIEETVWEIVRIR